MTDVKQTLVRYRTIHILLGALIVALMFGTFVRFASANPTEIPTFADPEFEQTWLRFDRPVFFGEVSRSYTWGGSISGGLQEPYAEGLNGNHLVQYFDKSRMEINDPNGDKSDPFFVTQGLLASDMIRGRIQVGNDDFIPAPQGPSQVPFGDLDDPTGPVYASFQPVLDAAPTPQGQVITARIDRAGNVTDDPSVAPFNVTATELFADTNHRIASVFETYINLSGIVHENGQNTQVAELYSPIQLVFGLPITEAYWTTLTAGDEQKTVLIQCFERRCLTYTPSNVPAFQVEMANTGLQYYQWRYNQPPTTTTGTTTTTTTTTTDEDETTTTTTTGTTTETTTTDTTTTDTTITTTTGTTITGTTTTTTDTATGTATAVGGASAP
jgi:hypothetical protein